MNIPISNTIIASIIFSVAMCFGIAVLAGLGRRAKKALVGMLKLYDDKNLIFFSVFWFLIFIATYTLVPYSPLLILASLPFSIWLVKKFFRVFKKRRNKHALESK